MKRREFIAGLGVAASWPLAARSQQGERVRRIAALLVATPDDADFQAWVGISLQTLALSGWTIGRNVQFDIRWATVKATEIGGMQQNWPRLNSPSDVASWHGADIRIFMSTRLSALGVVSRPLSWF